MSGRKRKRIADVKRKIKSNAISEKPAKASKHLNWFKNYYSEHPNMVAILYNRESSYPQDYNGNHDMHEQVLRRACRKLNIPVVSFYCETCSGKMLNNERRALRKAVRKALAKIKKWKSAIIIATSSDRFLRSVDFHTKESPSVLPTQTEFQKLQKLTRGVPLVTLLKPDKSWKKVRRYQSKWGQKIKGNKGGRPKINKPGYKKQRRLEKMPRVLRLRKKGASWGDVLALTGIAKSTAADWVRKHG